MLSVEQLDNLIVKSNEEDSFQEILDRLDPFDAANLLYLVHLINQCGDASFRSGYYQGADDFKDFISQRYRLEEKVNGDS